MIHVMRKYAFLICKNKDADQLRGNCAADQRLFFLNPKFQASSNLLWLYSPVCVGPGLNSEDRFSLDKVSSKVKDIGKQC